MARTLVVSAWDPEVAPLRRLLAAATGARARAAITEAVGVGAVDAAVGAARALARTRARRVIFVGTAGAYGSAAGADPIGAVVVAGALHLVSTAALRGDGYLPAPLAARAETTRALSAALRKHDQKEAGVPVLDVACPLAITRAAALGRRVAAATGAALENLEAFAVARAAAAAGAEVAVVLGITNRVGPRAHAEWRANHRAASEAACRAVWAFLTAPSRSSRRRS